MADTDFKFLGYIVPEMSFEIKNALLASSMHNNELQVEVQQNFSKDNNRFVEVVLKIRLKNENETLRFSLVVKGGFEADKEMKDELFKQMYNINAPAILFPYARAIISTVSAQAGIPQLIIPLVNFVAIQQKKELETTP